MHETDPVVELHVLEVLLSLVRSGLLLRRLLLVLRQRVAQLGDLPDLYACNISM